MNRLNADLTHRLVVLRPEVFAPHVDLAERLFYVQGGFGARPQTSGRKIFGRHVATQDDAVWSGNDVERFATPEEVARYAHAFPPPDLGD